MLNAMCSGFSFHTRNCGERSRTVNIYKTRLHLARLHARVYLCGHYLLWEQNSFPREWNTVSSEEQVISKDKYATMFSPQMETIESIILQISFTICAVWKIGKYPSDIPQFLLWNIQPRIAFKFRPLASDGRSLMDSNLRNLGCQSRYILILGIFGPKTVTYGSCARTMSGSQ